MAALKLYHNPRCSKSREALALLEAKGAEFAIVEYLKNSPTASEIEKLIRTSDDRPAAFVRTGDASFKEAGLSLAPDADAAEVAKLIAAHPALMQRPILASADKAVVGRPVENLLKLL